MSEKSVPDSPRLYEVILDSIKQLIIDEHLTVGAKLPSERELAERFGVSRVPVRESLKILEYIGIIDGTKGSGFYIRDIQFNDIFNKVNFAFTATTVTILEMMEVRISLESDAAYYAALRRDESDLATMSEGLRATRDLKKSNLNDDEVIEKLSVLSNNFHVAIIRAAKNSVLENVYRGLIDMFHVSRQFTFAHDSLSNNSLLAHEAIFEKIYSQKADSARVCMAEHLSEARDVFKQMIGEVK